VAAILVSAPHSRPWAPIALPVLRLPAAALRIAPLLLALLAAPAVYLSVTSDAVTTGATVEHLRTEREQWRQQNRQLEYELAKLQSLAWVENEAVNRLGMQSVRPVAFLNVDRPRPASARSGPASLARRDNAEVNPLLITPSLIDSITADASTSSALR
jgi:cell division protein FtsL